MPLSLVLSPGNEHDSKRFVEVLTSIRIGKGIGRPISRPEEVLADAAYDNNEIRLYLRRSGIKSNIPCNKRNLKAANRGRPTRFDQQSYRIRGCIERFFGWLKSGFRRLATRYERIQYLLHGTAQFGLFIIYWEKYSDEVLKWVR